MSRRLTTTLALPVATSLGLTALMIGVGFLLRTQPIAGPLVRDALHGWARSHDATVHVEAMRPTGFFGVRLQGVEVELARGRASVRLETPALDVRPALAPLVEGRVAPGHVRVRGGTLAVSPRTPERSSESTPRGPADPSAPSDPPSPAASDSEPPLPTKLPVEIELRDVDLRASAGGIETRPIRARQATIEAERSGNGWSVRRASGFGTFPGEVSFSLVSSSARETDRAEAPPAFYLRLRRPVGVSTLLDVGSPVDLTASGARICPNCRDRRLCVDSPSLAAEDVEFSSSEGCLSRAGPGAILRLEETSIVHGGEVLPYRWAGVRAEIFGEESPVQLEATLERDETDRLELEARAAPQKRAVELTLQTDGFELDDLWPALGLGAYLGGGRIEGRIGVDVFPASRLAAIRTDLESHNLTVDHRFVDERALDLQTNRLQMEALTDLSFENLSLANTKVTLGDLQPVRVAGSLLSADPGWAFEVDLEGRNLDAGRLRDSLPETVAAPAVGAKMAGRFDVSVYSSGHTSYPESLTLAVDVQGDVDVMRESPNADVPSLAVTGPPSPYLPALKKVRLPLSKWVDLESLGPVVPQVVLAAEDARFYHHPGFDWRGIRNAMVHNLEVGRLERGGSTITQQLAKNLFLTPDRTLSRKLQELWIAWRLEEDLGKDRILELYLNIVQWGPDVRGLFEAAEHYFETSPDQLTIPETILLGAILPGPNLYGPLLERGYLPSSRLEKVEHILNNLRYFGIVDQEEYEEIFVSAKWGLIAGYDLTICRDNDYAPAGVAPDCPAP